MKSPPPCPNTVTVRRNPPRRARPTPYSAAPPSQPPSSAIRSFPIEDILSITISDKPQPSCSGEPPDTEKLKVFLRIRPIVTQHKVGGSVKSGAPKNVWPQNPRKRGDSKNEKKKTVETCLKVNDEHSVTLRVPTDVRRMKSEVYEGFSHVFCDESTQSDVYEKMMNPLVVDFLKGKSGMLAAMGPSGSGKTHTVFGSVRQPGMVPLALRQIFSPTKSGTSNCSRTFYLSMFEIYSERGKGEKIMDLSQEGGDLYMQQSQIKGLKEVVIHDVQQAESLIASGMLKRSTAMTNSNIQSSRSQCIINIRCDLDNFVEDQSCTAILTIVDLAGAEREKRTGNQGARLLESNFINNTSMVLGLCLRSLLEHQKNPKKPLHKHFQNSLLTKYLRDFLEGKKRMALILTAKPGEEDYQDTSYLLRQASPFMNIKFEGVEEQALGNKRRTQTFPKAEQAKRMKLYSNEVCMDDEVKSGILHEPRKKEPDTKRSVTDPANEARENQILSNFSRALWNVLKEYKNKLEASENEADALRHSLTAEKERSAALEFELILMKASCSCGKVPIVEEKDEICSNAQVSSHSIKIECIKKKQITTDTDTTSVPLLPDCSNTVNLENTVCKLQVDAQVSCSNHCEQNVETGVVSSINVTNSVEVASTSVNAQSFEEQINEEKNGLCEYVVFDREDLIELGGTEFSNNISVYDTLEPGVSDSETLLHGDEGPFLIKGDQRKHEEEELVAQDSSSDLSESECFQKGDQKKHGEEELVAQDSSSDLSESECFQNRDQRKHDEEELFAQDSSSDLTESECFQKQDILYDTVTIDHEITPVQVILKESHLEHFEEHSKEKVDVASLNLVHDKQVVQETEERVTNGEIKGCDNLESAVCDSELHVRGTKIISFVKGDQGQQEEDSNVQSSSSNPSESHCFQKQDILYTTSNAQSSSSDPSESRCFEKQDILYDTSNAQSSSSDPSESQRFEKHDILDDTGVSFVEVISLFSDLEEFEDQSKEKADVSSSNLVFDKQGFKEVEETNANREVTVAEKVSSSLEEVQPEQDEKEVNTPISLSDLKGAKSVQLMDSAEAPDRQLVLPEDVISSESCNDRKLPEVLIVQPSQSLKAVKPKRRLRPASSVMLKNINILEFDDATTMPKQHRRGKRDENEDGRKRTQGNIALLRILKQNLRQ